MLAKTSTFFALFSIAAQTVVATPPACLIAAVNTQPDPSAHDLVCSGENVTAVVQYICQNCGANAELAMSDFASGCSAAGITIDTSASCSDNTTSTSANATATATATGGHAYRTGGFAAPTGYSTSNNTVNPPSSPTGSGSGNGTQATASASSTPAVSNTAPTARLGLDVVGMIALGVFGAMLAL